MACAIEDIEYHELTPSSFTAWQVNDQVEPIGRGIRLLYEDYPMMRIPWWLRLPFSRMYYCCGCANYFLGRLQVQDHVNPYGGDDDGDGET